MPTPVARPAMAKRFQAHLRDFGLLESESLHGLRAGGALSMALQGQSLTDIMLQGFWKSPATAMHYVGMLKEVVGDEFATYLQSVKGTDFVAQSLERSVLDPFAFLQTL